MRLIQSIVSQFGCPRGFWGSVAGLVMTYNPSNKERMRWTISLLGIRKNDRVLEIGFGPGVAIEEIGKITTVGFIAGIDHSEVMVRQARKRNAKTIREGRVDIKLGSVSSLHEFDEDFDKIFSINSIQFWDDPIQRLKELRRLLKPGGLIAITLQPRNRGATDETACELGKKIVADLEGAGFSQARLEIKKMKPVSSICALGIKSNSDTGL
ncbi:MAG: class I SAM-dependent methyltransferase [Candidatus Dadabacteria bacterium]|nr:class I SAM-dependent methyltransferase [Candidatus Dadabacteria bacterium]